MFTVVLNIVGLLFVVFLCVCDFKCPLQRRIQCLPRSGGSWSTYEQLEQHIWPNTARAAQLLNTSESNSNDPPVDADALSVKLTLKE